MTPIIIKNAISTELVKFILQEIAITRTCLGIVLPERYANIGSQGTYYSLISSENLLAFLTNKISDAVGVKLLPTFSWTEYASTGGKVDTYTGRSSCEYTAICCLESTSWPFYIDQVEYILEAGDICIYSGSESKYSRKEFAGAENIQVMLNYVDANGKYEHLALDSRKTLGASIALTAPIVQAEQAGLPFKPL